MIIKLEKELEKFIVDRIPYYWRTKYEKGEALTIVLKRNCLKQLYRWGNMAQITIKNGNLLSNSLIDNAWNWDEEKAAREAANALKFIIYDKNLISMEIIE